MPALASNELKERIQSFPAELRKCLEQQAKARIEIAHLKAQIDKLQAEIDEEKGLRDEDEVENDSVVNDYLDEDLEQLKLESAVKRLKLELIEAEDRAEMEIRQSSGRVTEGHVKAAIGTDQNVCRLRRALLDAEDAAKMRKLTLQHEKRLMREAELEARAARYSQQPVIEPENPEMSALQARLWEMQTELAYADLEVEVVRTSIDTFRMLVQLEG